MWRLNKMSLNNQCITEEINDEIKYTQRETNDNNNTTIQNLKTSKMGRKLKVCRWEEI